MIESTLKTFLSNYAEKNILIAYSGGVDSQVLLHCIASLNKQNHLATNIRVCHVDHGLSENSLTWQEFAQIQCQQFNLPLDIISVNIKAQPQKSIEALARDARYKAFKSVAGEGDLIVTGHHSNDQAETFLLALKRGSGLKGLSAMQHEMEFGRQLLVRPLLNVSRTEIEAYANTHNLTWIEDESNSDERFDRNFLRHQILPALNDRWPSINKTIARSSEHCFEAQQLLDELAEQDLQKCQNSAYQLDVAALVKHSQARLNNLLRYFLASHDMLMPSSQQLHQVCQQLHAEIDKSPVVQLADCCLRRYKGELHLTRIYQDLSLWQQVLPLAKAADGNDLNVVLPDDVGTVTFTLNIAATVEDEQIENQWQAAVKAPLPGQVVSISFSHENPKCLPQYRQHSRALKKVLQELSIPTWLRKRVAYIYYDKELVAVAGHFVCKPYLAVKQHAALHVSYLSGSSF